MPSEYLSFLLRLWRVSNGESPGASHEGWAWRIALQDTLTDEQISFASLDDLVAFLRLKMSVVSDAGRDAGGSGA